MRKKRIELTSLIKNYPNYIISIVGAVGFIGFYLSARATEGINSSLLVNLAAGSLIISVTVLVVDAIRSKQQRLSVEGAAVGGVSKIQMANFEVITILGDNQFHDLQTLQDQYIKDLTSNKAVPKKNYIDNYLVRLLNADDKKLLNGISNPQLNKLRNILTKSLETCDTTMSAYSYAFNNKLRGHLLNFRDTIRLCSSSLLDNQLTRQSGTERASQMLSIYLKQFQEFQNMKKY
jgi:hypothetical protein